MRLHEFEDLWPQRHGLDDSLRQELEHLAKTDKDCKAFVENGEWIRSLCRDIEPEPVPQDFAYRMEVFARNHMDDSEVEDKPRRSWLRWPAVATGLAAGALAMYVFVAPLMVVDPANPGAGTTTIGGQMMSSQIDESSNAIDSADLASLSDSTASENDSTQISRQSTPQPNWDIRTVSAEQ